MCALPCAGWMRVGWCLFQGSHSLCEGSLCVVCASCVVCGAAISQPLRQAHSLDWCSASQGLLQLSCLA